jgi:hypothetical protein
MLIGFIEGEAGEVGIEAGGVVDGFAVLLMPLIAELPAALGVLAAGVEVVEPVAPAAAVVEAFGEAESLPQLMAARSAVPMSQSRLAMLTS